MKRSLKMVGGVFVMIAGIAGLVLPIIPGVLLIVIALVLLGIIEKEHIDRFLNRRKAKQ